jgi:hypothetical protein
MRCVVKVARSKGKWNGIDNTNNILGSRINSQGSKTVGRDGFTRQNMTPKGICKDVKHDLNQKVLRETNE